MITFRISTDVVADRQVVLTLPPQTPLGKAELTVMVTPQGSMPSAGGLRRLFGTVRSGEPQGADNDRIDADLARAYGHLSE